MTDQIQPGPGGNFPEPVVRRKRMNAAWIWLVPAVAALVGLSLVINAWREQGPCASTTGSGEMAASRAA